MRAVFEHNEKRFIYDLDDDGCGSIRWLKAQACWQFSQEISAEKPGTWQQFEATGAADADLRGLAYLMMECDEDGNILKYDKEKSTARAIAFLEELPARWAPTLKEVKVDFFGRAGLYNLASLQLLGELFGATSKGELGAAVISSMVENEEKESESESSDSSSESSSSTSPANSTDDSADAVPNPQTTGMDSPSS